MSKGSGKCILVVGSCGLDRLLTVQNFPVPDSKVRTTSYNEVGGGTSTNRSSRNLPVVPKDTAAVFILVHTPPATHDR